MVVLIVERVRPSLRGELTRWLLEPKAGVFVGKISARVREKLWQKVCSQTGDGAAMILWSSDSEQGYRIDFWGNTSRRIFDWDGLQLVTHPD
jgi:CRISPR-associated protein Cas2